MSCEDLQCSKWKLIKGEDFDGRIFLLQDCADDQPFNLTGATVFDVAFLKDDDTVLIKSLLMGVTILSAEAGQVKVLLTDADTALLKAGTDLDVECHIVLPGGVDKIVKLSAILTVEESAYF